MLDVKGGSDVNRTSHNFCGLTNVLYFPVRLLFKQRCCWNHYWLLSNRLPSTFIQNTMFKKNDNLKCKCVSKLDHIKDLNWADKREHFNIYEKIDPEIST